VKRTEHGVRELWLHPKHRAVVGAEALDGTVETCLMLDLHGDVQAVNVGQGDRLIRRRLEETASPGRGSAMTKRKQQDTAWAEETGDPRHRLSTLLRVEMDPDGGEHHDVELVPASHEVWKVREIVVDPFNVGGRM
jgi:hypothetical protein